MSVHISEWEMNIRLLENKCNTTAHFDRHSILCYNEGVTDKKLLQFFLNRYCNNVIKRSEVRHSENGY